MRRYKPRQLTMPPPETPSPPKRFAKALLTQLIFHISRRSRGDATPPQLRATAPCRSVTESEGETMGDHRKSKTVSRTVKNAEPAEADQLGGARARVAKAREKASAREKKAQANVAAGTRQLDRALTTLERTDVGDPKARAAEAAARAALKELLGQRKKLRKAQKALRRAEAKARKATERATAKTVKKAPARKPSAQSRKMKKRPEEAPKRRQADAPARTTATKPSGAETLPAVEPVSGMQAPS